MYVGYGGGWEVQHLATRRRDAMDHVDYRQKDFPRKRFPAPNNYCDREHGMHVNVNAIKITVGAV